MKLLKTILGYFSNKTVMIVLLTAILGIIVDARSYRKRGYLKELKIINIISYSYIFIGVFLFVLLRIVK